MKKGLLWVLINAVIILLTMVGGWLVIDIIMQKYTRYMERVVIPNVVGMGLDSALQILRGSGLNPVIYDSTYMSGYGYNAVVHQEPPAGSITKSGRNVFIIKNISVPRYVTVPDLRGESVRNGIIQLSALSLYVDTVIYKPFYCEECIIELMNNEGVVPPGSRLPIYSHISIIAGRLDTLTIENPNLVGMELSAALDTLRQNNLYVGAIVVMGEDTYITDSSLYVVINQRPGGGVKVNAGTTVDIYVARKGKTEE